MAIRHTAVSYYGLNYEEHARADFREMLEHGCDTVILAITEFDMDFWFPNLNNIIKTAHDVGLRCLADLWGIGKYFGGEQVSLFLQNNIHNRQVSAMTGEPQSTRSPSVTRIRGRKPLKSVGCTATMPGATVFETRSSASPATGMFRPFFKT